MGRAGETERASGSTDTRGLRQGFQVREAKSNRKTRPALSQKLREQAAARETAWRRKGHSTGTTRSLNNLARSCTAKVETPCTWNSSSRPFLRRHSLALLATAPDLGHGVTTLGCRPLPSVEPLQREGRSPSPGSEVPYKGPPRSPMHPQVPRHAGFSLRVVPSPTVLHTLLLLKEEAFPSACAR